MGVNITLPLPYLILEDSNSIFWILTVNDLGAIDVAPSAATSAFTVNLNDPTYATSWQLAVTTLGALDPTSISQSSLYPTYALLVSTTGLTYWALYITSLGDVGTNPASPGFQEDSSSPVPCVGFDQTVTIW